MSLTPGFSRVLKPKLSASRFNGFFWSKTVETVSLF
jgi:hypothetical protein